MNEDKIEYIQQKTRKAKRKVLEMAVSAGMGHVTSAYSCAEIVSVLYYNVMRLNPQNPIWEDRDRFIMSKNHGSLMTYPVLADLGFFDENELTTFMCDGTRLGGHSKLAVPGVDFAGGSLGIGLGVGAGLAYAAKMDMKKFITFVLIGDGECYEGSIWEAAMFAAHNELNNLVAIVDKNNLCCTDFTENILRIEPISDKWSAFGWETCEINGHDINALLIVFDNIHERRSQKPLVIITNTVKGNGIDFISNLPLWHGIAPNGEDVKKAFEQLETSGK